MQITIQLDDKARRPIANINWFNGCRALIDTGALFPIWNKSEDGLVRHLGAVLIKKDVVFGGFGGEARGNLYRVNLDIKDNQPVRILRFSDDNNSISVYLAGTYETKDVYYN